MVSLSASKARIPPTLFNEVVYQGSRVRISRRKNEAVYLISEEDMQLLEELEDRYWADQGEEALAKFKKSGKKSVPLGKAKKNLGA